MTEALFSQLAMAVQDGIALGVSTSPSVSNGALLSDESMFAMSQGKLRQSALKLFLMLTVITQ